MALLSRTTASFDAIKPVPDLVKLDNEFNQLVGANGALNGGSTGNRIFTQYNHATEPVLQLNQLGAGLIQEWRQANNAKLAILNNGQINSAVPGGTSPISVTSTTVCPNLNADLIDGIDGSNIAKLDTHKTAFSVAFFEADPSTSTVNTEDRASWACPEGQSIIITKLWIRFIAGSHTSGGSVTFTFRQRSGGGGGLTDIGNVTLDNTNNTAFIIFKNDIADVPLTADDTITYYILSRSGTISERSVSLGFYGKQSFTT